MDGHSTTSRQTQQHSEAAESFRRYAEAFQSLDPKAVAQHFHEPSLLIAPQGIFALPSRADVEQAYGRVMADLPARGYARTEFSGLAARRLSDDLALVTGAGAWKTRTGEELTRFGLPCSLLAAGSA